MLTGNGIFIIAQSKKGVDLQKNTSIIKSKHENNSDINLLIIGDIKFQKAILDHINLSIAFDVTCTDINRANLHFVKKISPDLILIDISRPVHKGYTLLLQFKLDEQVRRIPVIIFSSKRSAAKISDVINPDVDALLVKPVKWHTFGGPLSVLKKGRIHRQEPTMPSFENDHCQIGYGTSDKHICVCLHELRNQLYAINAHSDLFLKKMKPNAVLSKKEYDRLTIINEASLNMAAILDKSCNINKRRKNDRYHNFVKSDINDIVIDTLKTYEPLAAEKKISIETSLDENLPYTMSDELSIKQAIGNYLSNAIKFSPDDTNVMISTKVKNGKVRLETKDEGPSITDEEQYILSGPRFALKPNFFLLNRFLQEI